MSGPGLEMVRSLYAYNEWANNRVLAAAAALDDAALTREHPGSHGSIAADLAHVVGAQVSWHSLLAGIARPERAPVPTANILATLRARFDESHGALKPVLEALTEESLTGTLSSTWGGEPIELVRWHVLVHVANHGTQHRAEVGIALLEAGASPGDLDFIYFIHPE